MPPLDVGTLSAGRSLDGAGGAGNSDPRYGFGPFDELHVSLRSMRSGRGVRHASGGAIGAPADGSHPCDACDACGGGFDRHSGVVDNDDDARGGGGLLLHAGGGNCGAGHGGESGAVAELHGGICGSEMRGICGSDARHGGGTPETSDVDCDSCDRHATDGAIGASAGNELKPGVHRSWLSRRCCCGDIVHALGAVAGCGGNAPGIVSASGCAISGELWPLLGVQCPAIAPGPGVKPLDDVVGDHETGLSDGTGSGTGAKFGAGDCAEGVSAVGALQSSLLKLGAEAACCDARGSIGDGVPCQPNGDVGGDHPGTGVPGCAGQRKPELESGCGGSCGGYAPDGGGMNPVVGGWG